MRPAHLTMQPLLYKCKSETGVDPHRWRSAGLTEVKGGGANLLI